jgi:PTS system mannose-specific IIB component/fructoselysine and glucoselysine-specific PTS system IIB component
MTVVLFRVDERLIHGQVVVGWAHRLHPRRVIVVHDAVASSAVEQDIYRSGLPEGIEAVFWTEAEAVARLPRVLESDEPAFVLTEDLETMWRLAVAGVAIAEINVGGLHASPERERVLPYVCLGDSDLKRIRELEAAGVRVTAQDVPTAAPVRLVEQAEE